MKRYFLAEQRKVLQADETPWTKVQSLKQQNKVQEVSQSKTMSKEDVNGTQHKNFI